MEEVTFKQKLKSESQKTPSKAEIKTFLRSSKHAPKEISSKIPASKFKKIEFVSAEDDPSSGKFTKKSKPRDPRFDKLSGKFNQGLFEASFSFLDEYRENELKEIKEAMESNKYKENYEELRKLFIKKKQELQRLKDKSRETKVKRELVKSEKEKVKKGKKPFFFKTKFVKMLAHKEKLKELKESGEYEEYSRKKRKREISKQKSEVYSLPSSRR